MIRLWLPTRVTPPPLIVPRLHGGKFAKLVRVAHFERHALACVGEVLRIAADNRKRIEVIVAAQPRGPLHHGVLVEHAAIAKFDFVAHDGKGADSNVLRPASPRSETTARGSISLIALLHRHVRDGCGAFSVHRP